MNKERPQKASFRPQARLLLLLGEQLIRDPGLAIFELVKNAYDADAQRCDITLHNIEDPDQARITVKDSGSGMTAETLKDVWLVIGTDFRATQRKGGQRSPRFHRLPLGEKGVGRLASHKLGRKIVLTTRVINGSEIVLTVDWDKLNASGQLRAFKVDIRNQTPLVFPGSKHGTQIEISKLREVWTKPKVRNLHRSIVSLSSPFNAPSDFKVNLSIKPNNDWLEGLLDVSSVLQDALYHARGYFEGNELVFDYNFSPVPGMRKLLHPRRESNLVHTLSKKTGRKVTPLDLSSYKIGRVNFEFHIFDREPRVLDLISDKTSLRKYLDENGGVRIYRDGMRVFDFGEPGNDWLNLDVRRVNKPVVRVSNNQLIGALMLNAEESIDLIEKTNREGFIENDAYAELRNAVTFALTQVEAQRHDDQRLVRLHYSRKGTQRPVVEEIADLRDALERRGLLDDFEPQINRIEKQFQETQEILLTAAAPGLTFASVVHEAEKIVKELVRAVDQKADLEKVKSLVHHLAQMMDGLTFLIRKSGYSKERASTLIQQALFNCELRFEAHQIRVTNGLDLGNPNFEIKCVRRLVIATLMNLIDNSIYWLDSTGQVRREIFIGTTTELDDLPALVVADNGPGFRDEPETVVQPFFSRKPDGMGLGLYLADEVARRQNGKLLFPLPGDVTLPKQFKGAIVALQFPEIQ